MTRKPHIEKHFTASDTVRDVVLGMADGLTVPFALAAGLTGAAAASGLIVTAGVAEIAAGAIAMGLGGYLAERGDAEHYARERRREHYEVREVTHREEEEVVEILGHYGLSRDDCAPVLAAFHQDHEAWVDFMMRFELGLEAPQPGRAMQSAATIGGAYVVGGLVPLVPYMLTRNVSHALGFSIASTAIALTVFGAVKGRIAGTGAWGSAWQTLLVGALAAGAAFLLARLIGA